MQIYRRISTFCLRSLVDRRFTISHVYDASWRWWSPLANWDAWPIWGFFSIFCGSEVLVCCIGCFGTQKRKAQDLFNLIIEAPFVLSCCFRYLILALPFCMNSTSLTCLFFIFDPSDSLAVLSAGALNMHTSCLSLMNVPNFVWLRLISAPGRPGLGSLMSLDWFWLQQNREFDGHFLAYKRSKGFSVFCVSPTKYDMFVWEWGVIRFPDH